MIRTTKESHARKAIGEPLQLWLVEQLRSFECKVAANGFGKTYAAHEQAMRQVDAMAKAVEIIPISVIQEHGREPLAVMSTNHLMKMFCAILSFTPIAEGANDNEIH